MRSYSGYGAIHEFRTHRNQACRLAKQRGPVPDDQWSSGPVPEPEVVCEVFPSSPDQPMPASGAHAEEEVRRGIRSMRWAIGGQAVLYLALAAFVGFLLSLGGTTSAAALPVTIVAINSALTIALVGCAVLLSKRQRTVVLAVVWLECGFMAMLLLGLILSLTTNSGSGGAPIGLILWGLLMQAVLRPLQKPEFRAAFGLKPMRPRQKKK